MYHSGRWGGIRAGIFVWLLFLMGHGQLLAATITCDLCRKEIIGYYQEYTVARKKSIICTNCVHSNPACTQCGLPQKKRELKVVRQTELWCRVCRGNSETCEMCQEPIAGRLFRFPNHPTQAWCEACYKTNETCMFCGRPADQSDSLQLDSQNVACRSCQNNAVSGMAEYEELVSTIHPQLEAILGKPFKRIPIRLMTPQELDAFILERNVLNPSSTEIAPEVKPDAGNNGSYLDPILPPATKKNEGNGLGLFTRTGDKREIVLLNHLPSDLAWETITHELTHAWQDEHYPGNKDFFLVEGFAQLVARKICMKNYRSTRLTTIAERDDAYGHAYRVVRMLEDEQGLEGVLQALERRALPEEFRTNSTTPYKENDSIGTITFN